MVERVEMLAYVSEDMAVHLLLALARVAQDAQLDEEQLLELLAVRGATQRLGRVGVVKVMERFSQRHQRQLLDERCGQRLVHRLRAGVVQALEQRLREALDAATVQTTLLHALRSGVVRLQAHGAQLQHIGGVNVGMRDVQPTVEHIGPSEHDVQLADEVVFLDPLERRGLKPDEVDDALPVGEVCD